jgi:SM-20-related protein
MGLSVDAVFDDAALDVLAERGFVVVDGWMGREAAQALRTALVQLQAHGFFAPARIGAGAGLHEDHEIRGDRVCWFDAEAGLPGGSGGSGRTGIRPGLEVAGFLARIGLLRERLNATCFLSLDVLECHAACYQPGGFYEAHLDTPAGDSRRVISFTHYLSERGTMDTGGCLRVHDGDGAITDIVPAFDRLVVFQSRRVLHEVRPVDAERFSMTGWLSSQGPIRS